MASEVKELLKQNAELLRMLRDVQAENKLLNKKIQALMTRLFGRKSEKWDLNQLQFLMGNAEEPSPDPDDDNPPPSSPRRKQRRKRKPRLPENLPTEEVRLDPDEVKNNPQDYKRIGEEVSQELDVIPAQYIRRRIIRGKYIKKADKLAAPIIAPLPARLLEGGYASAGIVTDILIKKYVDHLPLYRQEQILKNRHGIDLSRQVMSDWVGVGARWLGAIYRLIRKNLQESEYLQIDETPVKYCDKDGPPGGSQGYFWVYHDPWRNEVLYEWHTSRAGGCLEDTLGKFKGVVQCDGYGAYPSYAEGKDIDIACCWAHARRKFWEAKDESPLVSGWFLKQIQVLYSIESYLRKTKSTQERRQKVREQSGRWILDLLHKALRAKMATYLPKSQMGKAVHYTLGHWKELIKYCADGRIEIDNNGVENAVRPTALGKKNWLFIGHPQAGDRSAIIYTILENCKRLGINPQEYLKDVLSRLPAMKISEVPELLPENWAERRKAKVA